MKKVILGLLIIVLMGLLCACGGPEAKKFASAEEYEAALNEEDADIDSLGNAIVTFEVLSVHPGEDGGYNVWAGEHLNFIFEKNPHVVDGDTITVKVSQVNNYNGSWFMKSKKK